MSDSHVQRRQFLKQSGILLGSATLGGALPRTWALAPAFITPDYLRPQVAQGVQFGDVTQNQGLVWSRTDRPARMWVEYSYREDFHQAKKIRGSFALENTDYTARVDLSELKADRQVYVKVTFEDLTNDRAISEPVFGQFITAPGKKPRDIHSSGRVTPPGRAGVSILNLAACEFTIPCAEKIRTFLFIAATPSTPTVPSRNFRTRKTVWYGTT